MESFYRIVGYSQSSSGNKLYVDNDYGCVVLRDGIVYGAGLDPQLIGCKAVHMGRNNYCWGRSFQRPRDNFYAHKIMPKIKEFHLISYGDTTFSLFLTEEGLVYLNGKADIFTNVRYSSHPRPEHWIWQRLTGLPPIEKIWSRRDKGIVFFLSKDKRLYANGQNSFGELGIGDFSPISSSEEVHNVPIVREVGFGDYITYLISETGMLHVSGVISNIIPSDEYNDFPEPYSTSIFISQKALPPIKKIFYGNVLTETGILYQIPDEDNERWSRVFEPCVADTETGYRWHPRLRLTTDRRSVYPRFVLTIDGYSFCDRKYEGALCTLDQRIKKVEGDNGPIYLLTEKGDLYVLGNNKNGELGLGDYLPREDFVLVPNLPPVEDIVYDENCRALLITKGGDVYSTGFWRERTLEYILEGIDLDYEEEFTRNYNEPNRALNKWEMVLHKDSHVVYN